jgi:serine/threonine protein phosphatase PrpC
MQQYKTQIRIAARTDKGEIRYHNEDNFLVGTDLSTQQWAITDEIVESGALGALLVIADGMGGSNAGEVASQIAVEAIKNYFSQMVEIPFGSVQAYQYLDQALFQAHRAIVSHAAQNADCAGMGTTVMMAWLIGAKVYIGWSGDSRCYKYNPKIGLKLLTDDHSLVWEMVMKGELTEDQAAVHDERNIITQSLGADNYPPKPEYKTLDLAIGDRLLLCSDGLNSMLLDSEIKKVLDGSTGIYDNCCQLIEAANKAGGEDNTTIIIYELVGVGPVTQGLPTQKMKNNNATKEARNSNWAWILLPILLVVAAGIYWWSNRVV